MSEFEKAVTGLGEECGVFGAYDVDGHDVAASVYYGLFALQHRGQESCGIAVTDTYGKRKVLSKKGLGHVDDVFNEEGLSELKGNLGVGHVRYSTAGGTRVENAMPLVINYVKGTLAIAHNGNLVNAIELREELSQTGAIFQTTIDSEVIAYLIARERLHTPTAEEAVKCAMQKIKGAYALVVSSPRKMIGARDPFGLKPLCIGKRDNTYFLASESCAIAAVDGEFVRDVLPGEIVTITRKHGIQSDTSMVIDSEKQARCIFEYIYFARTDSTIDGDDKILYEQDWETSGWLEDRIITANLNGVPTTPGEYYTAVFEVTQANGDYAVSIYRSEDNVTGDKKEIAEADGKKQSYQLEMIVYQ